MQRLITRLAVVASMLALPAVAVAADYPDTVGEGAKGATARVVEHELDRKKADGRIGEGDVRALKQFQKDQGLQDDGRIGAQTALALRHRGEKTSPGPLGKQQAKWLKLEPLPELRPVEVVAEPKAPAPAAVEAPDPAPAQEQESQPTGGSGGYSIPSHIVQCESGGDYGALNPSGAGGAYQIMPGTWSAYGGTGSPHTASKAEQDRIAAKIYAAEGSAPWVCG